MDKREAEPKIIFDVDKDSPAEAFQKTKEKAERDLKKPSTHPDTWISYKENYWPRTEIEPTPQDASKAFSAYGSPPFYHIVIRHVKATTGIYDWHVSPSSGVIISRDVQKDENTALQELSLSEIIYHLLTKEVPRAEQMLGNKVSPPIQLTRLMQYNVASGYTFKVLKQIGLPQDDEAQTICKPDSDQCLALLGTVNLNSVIYLLKDHGAELGLAGIDNITLLKVKNSGKPITGFAVTFKRV